MHKTKCDLSIQIFALIGLMVLLSCSKNTAEFDTEAPSITIVSPTAEASFSAGENIPIQIDLQENNELHEFSAVVRGENVDTAFTVLSGHLHSRNTEVTESFQLPIENATYTLTVKASDHDNNLASETIIIYSN